MKRILNIMLAVVCTFAHLAVVPAQAKSTRWDELISLPFPGAYPTGGANQNFVKVKALSILLLLLLFGCAPSTQELIQQAHFTGDWSLVNKRIEAEERRKAERAPSCPTGTTRWCEIRGSDESCSCAKNSDFRWMLDSLIY
jgi:hypothetical protein